MPRPKLKLFDGINQGVLGQNRSKTQDGSLAWKERLKQVGGGHTL